MKGFKIIFFKRYSIQTVGAIAIAASILLLASTLQAREVEYTGSEATIYVEPGEPTQVSFPSRVSGGYKRTQSSLTIERQNENLIVFSQQELSESGEAIIVHLDDRRTYALRIKPASPRNPRDEMISIHDTRRPIVADDDEEMLRKPRAFAPPSIVSGLMRELVLVAEFGKQKGIPGYRRSNQYSGEVVLHDGAIEAKIDEIFMGSNLWGYVLTVTNLLDTTQRINPASFRLDGTRAVMAERWQLAPRPVTAEQQISKGHTGRVYIVTRAARN
jgi:hypothetical protein